MQSNKKITDKRRFSVVIKITAIVIVMAILIGSTAIYAGYYLHSTTMNQYYKNQVVNIMISIDSPSTNWKLKLTLFGNLRVLSPFRRA